MKNPPILEGETGSYTSGGREYHTVSRRQEPPAPRVPEGRRDLLDLHTLKNDLSAKTIEEVAKSLRPPEPCQAPEGPHGHRHQRRDGREHPMSEDNGAGPSARVGVIGAGYVGLVTGVCLASMG